jgi:hypothetical protein
MRERPRDRVLARDAAPGPPRRRLARADVGVTPPPRTRRAAAGLALRLRGGAQAEAVPSDVPFPFSGW